MPSPENQNESRTLLQKASADEKKGSRSAEPNRLPFRKKLAFLAILMAMAILFVEGLLLVLGISFPLLYRTDPYCAVLLRPNLNVRYCEEGHAIVRTNSQGFRDRERTTSKGENVFRIAVIGDSFCEAIQVSHEETFWSISEGLLNQQSGQEAKGLLRNSKDKVVEILNFGISGFGTAQEYELLRHYVLSHQPDLVILAVFTGNDIADNSREIKPGQLKPYYSIETGNLVLDDSFRNEPEFIRAESWSTRFKARLINQSRCLQLLNKVYSRLRSESSRRANVGIGLDPRLYRTPETAEWTKGWKVTEALVSTMNSCCEANDSEFLVVTVSNPIQVHPLPAVRQEFQQQHQIDSLFYPNERLQRFCNNSRIPFLDVSKSLAKEAWDTEPPVYFHGFPNTEMGAGHWNQRGHQRVAEILSEYLTSNWRSDEEPAAK